MVHPKVNTSKVLLQDNTINKGHHHKCNINSKALLLSKAVADKVVSVPV